VTLLLQELHFKDNWIRENDELTTGAVGHTSETGGRAPRVPGLAGQEFIFFIIFSINIHLFTCAYIVCVISPPDSLLHPLPRSLPLSLPGRTCSAFISNFVEEKT
jgi:hypothetical protein